MRYEAALDDYVSGAGETDGCFHKVHSAACEPFPICPCHRPGRPGRDKPTAHGSLHGKKLCKDHTSHYPGGPLFIGTTSPSSALILKQKSDVVIHLEGYLKELTALTIELCRSDMGDDIDIMTSVRGIGEKTATNFLVEMGGDIRKFTDHKKLIAMAGIDPAIYQSGKHDGHGRITKRGNRHLRRVIWLMTIRVIQFNNCFRNYYKKRTQDGLPFKKAVLATAHKLLRVIYAMLTQRTSFSYVANS